MHASFAVDESVPLPVRYSGGGGSGRSMTATQSAASLERMARFLQSKADGSTRSNGSNRRGGAGAEALSGTTASRPAGHSEGETTGTASRSALRLARPSPGQNGGGAVSQPSVGDATRTPRSSLATIGEGGSGSSSSSRESQSVHDYLRPTYSSAGKSGGGGGGGGGVSCGAEHKPRHSTASSTVTAACSSRTSTERTSSTFFAGVGTDALVDSNVDRDYCSSDSSSSSGIDMATLETSSCGTRAGAEKKDEVRKGLTLEDYTMIFGSSSEVSNGRRAFCFFFLVVV